ncbi:sialate O-acetylesterase [Paenibacillus roseipurpureus]|uniref:Sialate O-acetylesterase n=1 Tax=Paenibacillus roseopurpureus TaxID=2918901 RepID=A0AA96LRP9_9BACL|nr:sialate O-acetylesterase [Paenibacillus sp. MBLB1832]WNR45991.1 sialate O-acetylesterase [Paenibacillus sp. MBLB1832]
MNKFCKSVHSYESKVPFVASMLGTFMDLTSYPYAYMINEALMEVSSKLSSFRLVESEGLTHKGDFLHYDNPSAKQLGLRMAKVWLEIAMQTEA